jgi:hypothetical protein
MSTERIIRVTIPGYKKHQRDIKNREYLALELKFFGCRKVRQAKRECLDSIYCYQWLWANVDYETESIDIKESALKAEWMLECACNSNRYDLEKRLNALSNAELIEFQYVSNEDPIKAQSASNDVPNEVQPDSNSTLNNFQNESNDPLTDVQIDSNESLNDFKHPLETPETRTALLDININKLEEETKGIVDITEENSTLSARVLSFDFGMIAAEGRKYFEKHLSQLDASWVDDYLSSQMQRYLRYRDDMQPADFLSLWFEAVDSGKKNNAQAPKWFKTALESKVFEWKPRIKPVHSSVPSKPKHQVLLEAESLKYILDCRIFNPSDLEYVPHFNQDFRHSHFRVKSTGEMLEANFLKINEKEPAT